MIGGWFDGTMAWIGGASGDINDHDGHEFLCDDHDLDLNDYDDHDGGGAGAAGGDHQGTSNGHQMSSWKRIKKVQC